jgi:hypothetical protein
MKMTEQTKTTILTALDEMARNRDNEARGHRWAGDNFKSVRKQIREERDRAKWIASIIREEMLCRTS